MQPESIISADSDLNQFRPRLTLLKYTCRGYYTASVLYEVEFSTRLDWKLHTYILFIPGKRWCSRRKGGMRDVLSYNWLFILAQTIRAEGTITYNNILCISLPRIRPSAVNKRKVLRKGICEKYMGRMYVRVRQQCPRYLLVRLNHNKLSAVQHRYTSIFLSTFNRSRTILEKF